MGPSCDGNVSLGFSAEQLLTSHPVFNLEDNIYENGLHQPTCDNHRSPST